MSQPALTTEGERLEHPSRTSARDNEVLCAEELAVLLGVDRKTVYEYAGRGVIPHRRLGRRLLFSHAAVMAWLAACKVVATGKAA